MLASLQGFIMDITSYLEEFSLIQQAFIVGAIPALLTSIGSFASLVTGSKFSEKTYVPTMGFAAGVMLVASFTSLLIPASEIAPMSIIVVGFLLGVLLIRGLDSVTPHLHVIKGYEGPLDLRERIAKVWLIAMAVIIHNVPEGLAVGSAVSYEVGEGVSIAFAIGIQDIPEGLAVSAPVAMITNSIGIGILVGILSGVVELLSALLPPLFYGLSVSTLPLLMSLSAGAMLYIVIHEIIPDVMGSDYHEYATMGFLIGFIIMFGLDTILG